MMSRIFNIAALPGGHFKCWVALQDMRNFCSRHANAGPSRIAGV